MIGRDEAKVALQSAMYTDRCLLLMRYHEGLTDAEIGAALGVSQDAAGEMVAKALGRLKVAIRGTPGPETDRSRQPAPPGI